MKIVALLSFFDELPSFLAATVASCGRLCDHVVAVDGAYELFPQARPSSGAACHEAIVAAAEAAGLGLTLWVPTEPWVGNEVAKRNFAFHLGRQVAQSDEDWFLVIDGDEVIADVPADARAKLAATPRDVAKYGLSETFDLGRAQRDHESLRWVPHRQVQHVRGLFRNLPGLQVVGTHYRYVAERFGELVDLRETGDVCDLRHLRIEHRRDRRPDARNDAAREYYRTRDAAGVEVDYLDPRAAAR